MTRTNVGPYQVVRELGRGGMGVVLEVQRPGDPRRLALKLMLGEQDEAALARFRREAEVMARVDHANVVRVHAFDVTSEGPYLVTDFVEGKGLDGVLKERFLPCEQAARLVRDLADALEALHGKGILHRDLKPANVILRADGSPVLLDFGIARDLDSKERLTVTGALIGTPNYMAPEQANGVSPTRMGPPVDVYGLGTILYEALTCRPPFVAGNHMAILKKVMTEEPTWPSALRRDVPEALDAIVRMAMAKESLLRYRTAAALRDDLSKFLKGEEPVALKEAPRPAQRRPAVAALAALLVVGGVGVGVAVAARVKDKAVPVVADRRPAQVDREPVRAPMARTLLDDVTAEHKLLRRPLATLPHPGPRVRGQFLDDGRALTLDEAGGVKAWRIVAPKPVVDHEETHEFTGNNDLISVPEVVAHGRELFLRAGDSLYRLDEALRRLDRHGLADVGPLGITREADPARRRLVVPLPDGVLLLDPATWREVGRLRADEPFVRPLACVDVSARGEVALGGGEAAKDATSLEELTKTGRGQLHRWPPDGGAPTIDDIRLYSTVLDLAWSPDGAFLIAGAYGGFVLRARAGEPAQMIGAPPRDTQAVGVIRGHSELSHVKGVAFSPDGRWFVTVASKHHWSHGTAEDQLHLWSSATCAIVERYTLELSPESVAWSADGRLLLTGGRHAAHLWAVPERYWRSSDAVGSTTSSPSSSGR